jgi:hypothetical protein
MDHELSPLRLLELHERPPRGKAVVRMNPKGPPLVDLPTAALPSRRSLLGIVGAVGAVAALAPGRNAVASPNVPSTADIEVLTLGMAAELAVSDLYALAVDAGVSDSAFATIAADHKAYGEAIAGSIGRPASGRNEEIYAQFEAAFDSSDTAAVAATASQLEEVLVATHLQLVGQFDGTDPVDLITSILVVENRHATVLADIAGENDPATLLGTTEPATGGGGA